MESQVQFKELEEYALSHTRFSAPADTEDDFIEQYVNVLNKKGYHEGDFFFDDYMDYVYSAKQKEGICSMISEILNASSIPQMWC